MAAELITATTNVSPISGEAASAGDSGMVWGIYQVTVVNTNNDDIILAEFDTVYAVSASTLSSDVLTAVAVTVDAGTTNKIKFSASTAADVVSFIVWGTPANTD